MSKTLKLQKLSNRLTLNGSGGKLEARTVSRDWMQNFILHFVSLLTTLIVKSPHISAVNQLFIKKTSSTKLERISISSLDISEKVGKVAIK